MVDHPALALGGGGQKHLLDDLGQGGGGRPDMAQGGGPEGARAQEALAAVRDALEKVAA